MCYGHLSSCRTGSIECFVVCKRQAEVNDLSIATIPIENEKAGVFMLASPNSFGDVLMSALLKSLCLALLLAPMTTMAAPEMPVMPAAPAAPTVPSTPTMPSMPSVPAMPAAISAIDINSADAAQLESLPGIGPAKSKAIIDYRTKNGPFQNAADLEKVPGIGPKTMEQLAPLIMVKPGMPSMPTMPAVKK